MKILYIYLGISTAIFFLVWLQAVVWSRKFEREHLDLSNKKHKKDILLMFLNLIKLFVISFVPGVNLLLCGMILFQSKEIEAEVVKRVELRAKSANFDKN